jgi:hypothetical protein
MSSVQQSDFEDFRNLGTVVILPLLGTQVSKLSWYLRRSSVRLFPFHCSYLQYAASSLLLHL